MGLYEYNNLDIWESKGTLWTSSFLCFAASLTLRHQWSSSSASDLSHTYPEKNTKSGSMTWVLPKIGIPQNGWFTMENPIKILKMDDLGIPLFFGNIHMDVRNKKKKVLLAKWKGSQPTSAVDRSATLVEMIFLWHIITWQSSLNSWNLFSPKVYQKFQVYWAGGPVVSSMPSPSKGVDHKPLSGNISSTEVDRITLW